MNIKIRFSNGYLKFKLSDPKYQCFARLISIGYTEWEIDLSEVDTSLASGTQFSTSFIVEGWINSSERVLAFLRWIRTQKRLGELIDSLEQSSNPGDFLDSLVN